MTQNTKSIAETPESKRIGNGVRVCLIQVAYIVIYFFSE